MVTAFNTRKYNEVHAKLNYFVRKKFTLCVKKEASMKLAITLFS